ncbi:unnamed protein product [Adineta ricciae]|uniref:TauD/TfdA-like domain-containing protein n=1 Tax=Adineta ricciae TaxID=249248 RepID=A0A815U816_ADIRI|nr:unnamed protein product [Adineta ricciae]
MASVKSQIIDLLERKLLSIHASSPSDMYATYGQNVLLEQIQERIQLNESIAFLLPGFPFKSPNPNKVSGRLPDGGDVYALEYLNEFCREVSFIYEHGCELLIWSDGRVFNDLIGVSNEDLITYENLIKQYSATMTHFKWDNMDAHIESRNGDDLVKQYGTSSFNFEQWLKMSPNNQKEFIHLRSFLENDLGQTSLRKTLSRKKFKQAMSWTAEQMITRNNALTNLLKQHYPNHIRLSIHQHSNNGEKFTIQFFANHSIKSDTFSLRTPWHNVLVISTDGARNLLPLFKVKLQSEHVPLMYKNQIWCYVQLPQTSLVESVPMLKLSLLGDSTRFGIAIDLDKQIEVFQLDVTWMKMLLNTFGVVVIRRCKTSLDKESYSRFCEQYGPPVVWNFGSLLVLKPVLTPESGHQSRESMPLHFDLCYPPEYLLKTGLYEDYVPQYFMLYCVKAPVENGGGKTNFVNGRLLLESMDEKEIQHWKTTNISSSTPKSYFGGKSFTYPIVMSHPRTNENILRYLETSTTTYQPVENIHSINGDSKAMESFDEFNKEMKEKMRDPKWYLEHTWADDDLVLIENHLLLHGRTAISEETDRELWRIQVY